MAVTSFVYRAVILDNGLLDSANIDRQQNKTIYSFVCSRARMNNVLDDLAGVWSKFKTAKFILGNSNSGAVVNNINPEQVMQILTQRNWPDQVKLAKDFDIMNKITEANPAADPIAAIDSANIEISKPVLTSGEKKVVPKDPVGVEKINLVISVFGI
jgi:hypothetical protein